MVKKGKIYFFTGKGGVGKSLLSFNMAKAHAKKGNKTLWLEFAQEPTSTSKKYTGFDLGFKPIEIEPDLHVASWNGEDCLQEFVKHSVKLRLIYETFYRSKAISALIKAAPALKEIAFLGYLTSHFRDVKPALEFDSIIVDAPSSGHFLSCLKVPSALLEIASSGPMGFHCKGILEVLKDPNCVQIFLVSLPEPLVMKEFDFLQKELAYLGLSSQPWMNRLLNPDLIKDIQLIAKENMELKNNVIFKDLKMKSDIESKILLNIDSTKILRTYEIDLNTESDNTNNDIMVDLNHD